MSASNLTTTNPKGATRPGANDTSLSVRRMNLMRIGYLVMVVGLALVKWPLFFQDAGSGPCPCSKG